MVALLTAAFWPAVFLVLLVLAYRAGNRVLDEGTVKNGFGERVDKVESRLDELESRIRSEGSFQALSASMKVKR